SITRATTKPAAPTHLRGEEVAIGDLLARADVEKRLGSVEQVRELDAHHVLTGERLPPIVGGEDTVLARLVMAVLEPAVEVLGQEVFPRESPLPERLPETGAAPAVVLEPLTAGGHRGAVGERVVRNPGEALPDGGATRQRRILFVCPVVVEEQRERGGGLDGRDEID